VCARAEGSLVRGSLHYDVAFFVAEENLGEIHRGISEWSITFPPTSWRFEAEWIEHYLTQPA
jgi:hypothetical protein